VQKQKLHVILILIVRTFHFYFNCNILLSIISEHTIDASVHHHHHYQLPVMQLPDALVNNSRNALLVASRSLTTTLINNSNCLLTFRDIMMQQHQHQIHQQQTIEMNENINEYEVSPAISVSLSPNSSLKRAPPLSPRTQPKQYTLKTINSLQQQQNETKLAPIKCEHQSSNSETIQEAAADDDGDHEIQKIGKLWLIHIYLRSKLNHYPPDISPDKSPFGKGPATTISRTCTLLSPIINSVLVSLCTE